MNLIYLVFIAISLALDTFAVSISCGMTRSTSKWRLALLLGLYFGGFQLGMTLIGGAFGKGFSWIISSLDHFVAFLLLLIIGSRMVHEGLAHWKEAKECRALTHKVMFGLAVATSIDALAVGITFGVLDYGILISAAVIGLVSFLLSFGGVLIGDAIKGKFDKIAEMVGGLVLVAIGTKILVEHLFR